MIFVIAALCSLSIGLGAWLCTMGKEDNIFLGVFVQLCKMGRMSRLEGGYRNPAGFLVCSSST